MPGSVFLTGASGGLGEGMSRAFASRGYSLALTGRRVDKLEELASELRAGGSPRVVVHSLDVTDYGSIPPVLAEAAAELGGIDIVVANSGIGAPAPVGRGAFEAARRVIETLREKRVEAVGVCLLWSIANPSHEQRVGALLAEHLPGVPFTLSHELNPTLREYRRASSTCIDASLKPLMYDYLHGLAARLREAGFAGRVLMVTSQGGIMDAEFDLFADVMRRLDPATQFTRRAVDLARARLGNEAGLVGAAKLVFDRLGVDRHVR